jgi:hypothetical protein
VHLRGGKKKKGREGQISPHIDDKLNLKLLEVKESPFEEFFEAICKKSL